MTEFITGLVLGTALTFFITQYHRWKSCLIADSTAKERTNDNTQWQNIMNYDGSGRGQKTDEN